MHLALSLDIDQLSEIELIALNARAVARLRQIWEIEAHRCMMSFEIGEKVWVARVGRPPLRGVIIRFNRRTVSIVTYADQRWHVSPWLLMKNKSSRVVSPHRDSALAIVPPGRLRF